jgi:hypothetical protein
MITELQASRSTGDALSTESLELLSNPVWVDSKFQKCLVHKSEQSFLQHLRFYTVWLTMSFAIRK